VGIVQACEKKQSILAESKYNQWSIHKSLGAPSNKRKSLGTSFGGGVVPNVARMLHRQNLVYAVSDCIKKINWKQIDAIALTVKPGLEPCVLKWLLKYLFLNSYKLRL